MGVAKSRTRLSDFTFAFHFDALEKEMATHSSVLAWRIPGMGEPGGLPSLGSHRFGHDWSDLAAAAAARGKFVKPKIRNTHWHIWGFPHSSVGKESAYNAWHLGSNPGSGRSLGEGHSYLFQYTCLETPMDRGVWRATIHGVSKVRHDLVTKPLTLAYIKILHENTQWTKRL